MQKKLLMHLFCLLFVFDFVKVKRLLIFQIVTSNPNWYVVRHFHYKCAMSFNTRGHFYSRTLE